MKAQALQQQDEEEVISTITKDTDQQLHQDYEESSFQKKSINATRFHTVLACIVVGIFIWMLFGYSGGNVGQLDVIVRGQEIAKMGHQEQQILDSNAQSISATTQIDSDSIKPISQNAQLVEHNLQNSQQTQPEPIALPLNTEPLQQIKMHEFKFIRHGQSGFNKGWYDLDMRKAPYQSYVQIRYGMSMMDVSITQTGKLQAQQARKMLQNQYKNIGIVVVSPLRRALQTCDIIFGDKKQIKVIVEPLLTERMGASCDIGGRIKQSYQLYGNKFDFSKFTKQSIEKSNWFMQLIDNDQIKATIERSVQNGMSYPAATIELMRGTTIQAEKQERKRSYKLKQELRKLIRQTDKKIALVGHGGIFGIIVAKEFNENNRPVVQRQFKNAFPEDIQIDLTM